LSGVHNPTATNYTFFVRIKTFPTDVPTPGDPGTIIDSGTVTASTATQIILTGTMPESLVFCAGSTVGTTSGVPDCSTAGTGSIQFDQLFSPTDTASSRSQMSASTNATSGYNITVNGTTLTSGSNTIDAMNTAGASTYGIKQFGMNLVANAGVNATTTPLGADIDPVSNNGNYKGQAATGYDVADLYKFTSGDVVANSSNGGSAGPTDAQIYTVSYIANVTGSLAAGDYTTTLTYICTPFF
jgi:hypothetical protein